MFFLARKFCLLRKHFLQERARAVYLQKIFLLREKFVHRLPTKHFLLNCNFSLLRNISDETQTRCTCRKSFVKKKFGARVAKKMFSFGTKIFAC